MPTPPAHSPTPQVQTTFGSTQEYANNNMDHGYILFYERAGAGAGGGSVVGSSLLPKL